MQGEKQIVVNTGSGSLLLSLLVGEGFMSTRPKYAGRKQPKLGDNKGGKKSWYQDSREVQTLLAFRLETFPERGWVGE